MLPINETMGQYSELFMLLAAGTYTVAFIAFAWDLAKSSKTLRAVDLKAAELSGAAAARVPVAAGVGSSSPHLPLPPGLLTGPTLTWPDPLAGPSGRRRPWRVLPGTPPASARPPTAPCATPPSAAPRPGSLSP